uniref:nucleotidyltransferase family protein n=1 Tax=Pseudomonas laurentiana TaxID=2364649 RepID=UPI0029C9665D|nr:nucleotidyltransferase family protein [Pseudomonas laurentiana]
MKQWEHALVSPQTSLNDAVAVMDKAALRIVMVVGPDRVLLGTLTDGDVRRALLSHYPLESEVSGVMCKTPRAVKGKWSREQILTTMEQYKILQMPVVDAQGRVIGLETLQDMLQRKHLDNPVFLMAGGFGTRLRPLTQNCPKPLLKIGEKPILELILESFVEAGFHRFFISTHFLPDMIKEHFGDGSQWGISIQYVHEDEPLGTGGALGLLPHDEIDLPLFVMNGDLLTRLDFKSLLDFHYAHEGVATMCVREHEHRVPYGVVTSEGHRIKSMVEKPVYRYFINAGIYLLSPALVKTIQRNVQIDMPTILEQQMSAGKNVNMFPVHEYWLDIGRMEDFQRAQDEFGIL